MTKEEMRASAEEIFGNVLKNRVTCSLAPNVQFLMSPEGYSNLIHGMVKLGERVERETLLGRIEWPSEEDQEKARWKYLTGYPDTGSSQYNSWDDGIAWLRDNVKVVPNELVKKRMREK